eukprot:2574678-Amphidinium_carterae.1
MTWASALPQWRGNLTRIAVTYSRNFAGYDPSCTKLVLITGGPPCWDHSRIKRHATGASGAEGQKTMLAASLV